MIRKVDEAKENLEIFQQGGRRHYKNKKSKILRKNKKKINKKSKLKLKGGSSGNKMLESLGIEGRMAQTSGYSGSESLSRKDDLAELREIFYNDEDMSWLAYYSRTKPKKFEDLKAMLDDKYQEYLQDESVNDDARLQGNLVKMATIEMFREKGTLEIIRKYVEEKSKQQNL